MLINEKKPSTALIQYAGFGAYNGSGNYITPERNRFSLSLVKLEKDALPNAMAEFVSAFEPKKASYSEITKIKKADLPLASDIRGTSDPNTLIYTRLEGLQYYTKKNNM